jgi:hypothetical protein
MKYHFLFLIVLMGFFSCNQPEGFKEAEDPIDAGREFVRAVLDGNYEKAVLYIEDNQEDKDLFERYKQYMNNQPKKEKLQLKSSSIIINKVENLSDSVSIVNFSNSYSMKPTELKIVQKNKKWVVDFSYTFSGNIPNNDVH